MRKIIEHLKENWIRYGFETLVVLVGIIGAFALNDWNQNRKSSKERSIFIESIAKELSKDTLLFSAEIRYHKKELKSLENYYNRIYTNGTIDTLINIARFEFYRVNDEIPNLHGNTFKMLVSSGDIGTFDYDLTDQLMELEKLQSQKIWSLRRAWDYHQVMIMDFHKIYPHSTAALNSVFSMDEEVVNNHFITKLAWSNFDHKHFTTSFMQILAARRVITIMTIKSFEELQNETNKVLIELGKR